MPTSAGGPGLLALFLTGAFSAGCGGAASSPGAADGGPARIIVLSMDTVRADRIDGYGSANNTPHLAGIAAEGLLFRDSYAASTYTIPSHMSVFTGLDAAEHGVYSRIAKLSPDVPTLAEILRGAGYRTQAFHEGGYIDARFGFDRGFEAYEERPRIEVARAALPEVLDWMRAAQDERYFLFLHTYAAHFPYGGLDRFRAENPGRDIPSDAELLAIRDMVGELNLVEVPRKERALYALYNQFAERHETVIGTGDSRLPSAFRNSKSYARDLASIQESYADRIRLIDRAIGEIQETLTALGQWEDTLLIVISDHGEAFFEHELQRHDYIPFDEVVRVPLVFSYPRLLRDRGEHQVDGLVWHLDLLPTILSLAGIEPPPGLHGMDLTPVLAGQPLPAGRAVFPAVLRPAFREPRPLRRVTLSRGLKHIEGHPHFGDELGFLFDLRSDPGERSNLRDERADDLKKLRRKTRRFVEGLRPTSPVHQQTNEPLLELLNTEGDGLSAEELEKLRALGYVDE